MFCVSKHAKVVWKASHLHESIFDINIILGHRRRDSVRHLGTVIEGDIDSIVLSSLQWSSGTNLGNAVPVLAFDKNSMGRARSLDPYCIHAPHGIPSLNRDNCETPRFNVRMTHVRVCILRYEVQRYPVKTGMANVAS